jgi:hypothetical protein
MSDNYWSPDSAFKISESAVKLTREYPRNDAQKMAAAMITMMEDVRHAHPEAGRHASLAITAIEEAFIWMQRAINDVVISAPDA